MATIRKEILVRASPESVWSAVRDVGEVHRRLCPGVLVDCRMDGDARVVTFANGLVVRELIVDIDDDARRFSWAAVGGRLTHHNASMQVFPDPAGGTRLVWIADLLPDELEADIRALMDLGSAALKKTVE
ncbi:MAG TPA: SRPBCC family protein [Myxococcales bacterium]|jgi:carbon monoxide dehydrogenase subunit G|nr:SRPBCC family protein [Myxococcales bacterium]